MLYSSIVSDLRALGASLKTYRKDRDGAIAER